MMMPRVLFFITPRNNLISKMSTFLLQSPETPATSKASNNANCEEKNAANDATNQKRSADRRSGRNDPRSSEQVDHFRVVGQVIDENADVFGCHHIEHVDGLRVTTGHEESAIVEGDARRACQILDLAFWHRIGLQPHGSVEIERENAGESLVIRSDEQNSGHGIDEEKGGPADFGRPVSEVELRWVVEIQIQIVGYVEGDDARFSFVGNQQCHGHCIKGTATNGVELCTVGNNSMSIHMKVADSNIKP